MLLSATYLVFGILAFFITLVMIFRLVTNKSLNFYLSLISLLLSAYIGLYGFKNLFFMYDLSFLNFNTFNLFLVPAVKLFFKKLVSEFKQPTIYDLVYFIFPFCLLILLYDILRIDNNYFFQFLFFFTYNFFYMLFIIKDVSKINRNRNYSKVIIKLSSFIFVITICIQLHFLLTICFRSAVNFDRLKFIFDLTFLFLCVIAYLIVLLTPELLYGRNFRNFNVTKIKVEDYDVEFPSVWKLNINIKIEAHKDIVLQKRIDDSVSEYIGIIDNAVLTNLLFRKKNYSMHDLSIDLGLPKYYIEFLFKYHCDLNFDSYKRLVRVYDAILLINSGYLKHNTLNSLSDFVGFSSYNPFFLSFKQIMGVTPYEFIKISKQKSKPIFYLY